MTDATNTVAIAADHAGYTLKDQLKPVIEAHGLTVLDLGTNGPDRVDYPDFGHAVAVAIRTGRATRGLVVCGTGIGISIATNRHRGVRAALCHDVTTARLSRQHNDANVLALGARIIGFETAQDCLAVFLSTAYDGGRHGDRIAKIDVPTA
ncbi:MULTISPECIES: ribose 5-phosphate isomerase B [Inquilinus]|uniref:Ribose 5-phosphate isomerase B n=1 Tax=Inquilinus ginsengisoli TaxID=363840 RepID=A0ABU1JRJ8_9PROT|nr:ribose 5-phosphate isomerase B [Inquilinus ginsengisoli]MDR6291227.1 ribose 5-phosphate isomerase B [Inquilinus ginsengisoli]